MIRKRLLVLILLATFLLVYPKVTLAVEQNAMNQASSQASITFLQDNTPPSKEMNESGIHNNFLGDLGIGKGKRLPNTGEVVKIIWISLGFLILVLIIFIIIYYYLIGGKKMKLWKSMLVTTAILGSLAAPTITFADETIGDEKGKKDATSFGAVTLQAGDETTVPETENPGEEEGGDTGNTGQLAITFVSPLDFGEFKLTGNQEVIAAKNTAPNIQVRDIRGTGKGWTVQVSMTEFKQREDATIVMKGASLYLPKGVAKSKEATASTPPTTREVISVNTKAQTVFEAPNQTGAGAWMDQFGENNIKLTIPQDALIGDYKAQLTWTISDTPGKK